MWPVIASLLPTIIPAVTNLLGGKYAADTAAKSQSDTNVMNMEEAERNRTFQQSQFESTQKYNTAEAISARNFASAEADKNRQFEEKMSNSAYQRAREDMRKAGFNPMLAYQQGGASTPAGNAPSGPSASGSNTSGAQGRAEAANMAASLLGDTVKNTVSSAMEGRRNQEEVQRLKAQVESEKANKEKIKAETAYAANLANSEQIRSRLLESGMAAAREQQRYDELKYKARSNKLYFYTREALDTLGSAAGTAMNSAIGYKAMKWNPKLQPLSSPE